MKRLDLLTLFGPEWAIVVDAHGRITIIRNPYLSKDAPKR
jgi:hypothetical protein